MILIEIGYSIELNEGLSKLSNILEANIFY